MNYNIGLNIIVDKELDTEELRTIQKRILYTCECLARQLNKNICFIFSEETMNSKSGLMSVNFVDGILTVNKKTD